MVVAAASVRGLATDLVLLRGALIRTGIGALVIAASELIYQFGSLVQATGGFGAALSLLDDVATEVWERIGLMVEAMAMRATAAWRGIQASVAEALQASLEAVIGFGNGVINTFQGAFDGMVVIWGDLPRTIGDLTIQAANALIAGLEAMLNGAVGGLNGLLEGLNAGRAAIGLERTLTLVPEIDLGRVESQLAGAAGRAGAAASDAFAAAFATDAVATPDLGFAAFADEARRAAENARAAAATTSALAGAPLASVAAIREAMAGASTEIDNAAVATERLDEAFAAVGGSGGGAGGGSGGAAEGSAGSAAGAAVAAGTAGRAIAAAADQAATGWAGVRDALARYAGDAADWGQGVGSALGGAFRTAEDALAGFVAGGKLDFQGLADSIMADLTRIAIRSAILGPIAGALGGMGTGDGLFGGLFGGGGEAGMLAGIFHAGGLVGAPAPQRLVPALAFAHAPRLHAGGMAGLRPDEVPAILQRGELVLSRAQIAGVGAARDTRPPVTVVMNITTPDANGFRQSQGQIAADAARAIERARRNL
jgi:hypothetical protein